MKDFRPARMASVTAALAAAGMLVGASSASATPVSGSAVLATARDCGATAAAQNCGGAGTTIIYQAYAGGPGQGVNFFDGDTGGNFVQSVVSLGGTGLPVVNQSDAAAADSNLRINVNAFAFNSFTYDGPTSSELSYAGNLHIVDSSGAPLGNSTFAGGAGYNIWVAIWDPALVAGFNNAADAFQGSGYGSYDCSTPGVYAFGGSAGALSGGEQNISVATQSCSGGTFVINPGQEVLAVAWLQTPVNRGGWIDASHTFQMGYDPTLSEGVRDTLVQNMIPGTPGVPEPASWAMMVGGFGLVGAAVRRRRTAVAA